MAHPDNTALQRVADYLILCNVHPTGTFNPLSTFGPQRQAAGFEGWWVTLSRPPCQASQIIGAETNRITRSLVFCLIAAEPGAWLLCFLRDPKFPRGQIMRKTILLATALSFTGLGLTGFGAVVAQAQTNTAPPTIGCGGSGTGSWPNCGGGAATVPPATSTTPQSTLPPPPVPMPPPLAAPSPTAPSATPGLSPSPSTNLSPGTSTSSPGLSPPAP